uniref:Tubulin delta chain n=1 Tax=Amphimedon queenslandica TaxID=400682 RepID=A0A1X7SWJ1_AMPQE
MASTVVVQLGQCGNQMGPQLFSLLLSDASATCKSPSLSSSSSNYYQKTLSRYFHKNDGKNTLKARSVLIDTELKVIESSLVEAKRGGAWEYDSSSIYKGRQGSGNNWAHGFYQHGPAAHEGILNAVQGEAEKCDSLEGFLILMSVAGGTGSGLGTYVTQLLHDEYPTSCLVNPVIWPYASGEVIVQNYNALLTTASLYGSSDAVILLPNDHLHKVCSKLLHLKEISFKDLNKVATHILASILQPAVPHSSLCSARDSSLLSNWCSLSDLCTSLTPHSSYRLLSIKSLPQMPKHSHAYTNYLWAGLIKYLRQMLLTDSFIEEGMDWSSSLGKDLHELDPSNLFSDQSMYSNSVPPSMRQW